ncbi:hypothetical protein ACFY20_41820 [Streptomyces sp. NPDC001312]
MTAADQLMRDADRVVTREEPLGDLPGGTEGVASTPVPATALLDDSGDS